MRSAQLMLQCFKQLSRQKIIIKRTYPRTKTAGKTKDLFLSKKIDILSSFPGIGADKATRLLMKFNTLQAIFAAKEEDFLQVPGMGKKTAESLYKLLKE